MTGTRSSPRVICKPEPSYAATVYSPRRTRSNVNGANAGVRSVHVSASSAAGISGAFITLGTRTPRVVSRRPSGSATPHRRFRIAAASPASLTAIHVPPPCKSTGHTARCPPHQCARGRRAFARVRRSSRFATSRNPSRAGTTETVHMSGPHRGGRRHAESFRNGDSGPVEQHGDQRAVMDRVLDYERDLAAKGRHHFGTRTARLGDDVQAHLSIERQVIEILERDAEVNQFVGGADRIG